MKETQVLKEKTIGILGGGQLGKMLCEAALDLGYKTIVLDANKDACAKQKTDFFINAKYDDKDALEKLAKNTCLITYEFEHIPTETIKLLEDFGANIPQGARPLSLSQDRTKEKKALKKINIPIVPYFEVLSKIDLEECAKKLGFPVILKTSLGGYDGKGQWLIKDVEDLKKVKLENIAYVLEKAIDIKYEVSCIAVRAKNKEIELFPIARNVHKNAILDISQVPSPLSKDLEEKIKSYSKNIIEKLDFIGPLAIEYFISKDLKIYFNEMAPRPHNSGHFSLDACNISQFELHLRSILGLELIKPKLLRKVLMQNILGEDKKSIENLKSDKNTKVYLYGKDIWKKGRKMGHINILGDFIK